MSLSAALKSIQDIMRKDVGVDGDAQRLGQLVWLLFLKVWSTREDDFEATTDDFASPLVDVTWLEGGERKSAADLRWRTWAAPRDEQGQLIKKTATGDELLAFVNGTLFPALKGLEVGPVVEGDDPASIKARQLRERRLLIRSVFEDAYQYMKSGTLLRQVIDKLEESIDLGSMQNRHLFGDLYEQLLRDLQGAGNAGEFYTPRAVTQFAVDQIDPRLGEVILDPACGTGGFLTCALQHLHGQTRDAERWRAQQANVRGIEKKPLPHLLCVTNLIVHEVDQPRIEHRNTLRQAIADLTDDDRVDVILTNPPFGGMEEDDIERGFPPEFRTRETADLFLVLIIELLKDGGRAAVVLPDGTLFGEGVKTAIKKRLLSECELHTIVRLPKGVFAPYTSIRTNLLFFKKGLPTKEIWFYEHPYPEGYKSYSKTKPMKIEEFAGEKAWWGHRVEGPHAWRVGIQEIEARGYNLDISNPNAPGVSHEDPDELLARFERERAVAAGLRNELRDLLAKALGV
jgi:type I restriction enzyme M protein